MDRWTGKVAVVTGASAGIGLAIAQALLREGLRVVGLARRKTLLEEEIKKLNINDNFYACECDITDQQSIDSAFKWVINNLKIVHILINNAGIGFIGSIDTTNFDDLKKVIDTNFTGLLYCTKKALEIIKKDEEAHIFNISSILGHQVINSSNIRHCNIYPATKSAVRALSETLVGELKDYNIRITNLSPGFVRTDMIKNNFSDTYNHEILESQDIAHAVLFALGAPFRVQVQEMIITSPKLLPIL